MDIGDIAEEAAKSLVPPEFNPGRRLKYDLAVSISLGVIAMGFGLHIAIACGYLASYGVSGFALASDFQSQQIQLTNIQISQDQRDVNDSVRNVCLAEAAKNQAALTAWSNTLQQERYRYFQDAKRLPDMKTCDEIVIRVNP